MATSIRRDLLVNYLGQGWTALMSVAFIPFYIHYLGIESYGLIGLFVLLQSWMTMLDFGLAPILNREMARMKAGATSASAARTVLRGAEIAVGGASLVAAAVVWAGSGWLAEHWLRVDTLPVAAVAFAISVMGLTAATRSVEGLYRGAALGQDRQAFVNVVTSGMATLRGAGAVAVLAWVQPSVAAFFLWQLLMSAATCAVLAAAVYSELAVGRSERLSLRTLKTFRGFAGGMLGITLLSLLLTQVDKLLLSKLLPLTEYGYYALASAVATALYLLVYPVTQAFYPRFTRAVTENDGASAAAAYHRGAQLVAVLAAPAAFTLLAFAVEALHLWTRDAQVAEQAGRLLRPLCLGTLCNGLMWIPYQMQLAHGHTRTALKVNFVAVLLVVPAILWSTPRYGALGAAWVWCALNAGYVIVGMQVMYRSLMQAERGRWYRDDVIRPLLAAALVVAAFRWLTPDGIGDALLAVTLVSCFVLAAIASVLAAPDLRVAVLRSLMLFRRVPG